VFTVSLIEFMVTLSFHTTVPSDCMMALPPEFRGEPVRIVVKKEPPKSPTRKGILSIAGILKDCPNENIHDERYEYLMEKYGHGKNTD